MKQRPKLFGFTDTTNEINLRNALLGGTSLNATEKVCTVDGYNVPTLHGHARSEMRLKRLWHRATYTVVRCEELEEKSSTHLLVQRRSNIKDYCPGKLDPSPGGVVGFGESYELNARREMAEEMGIDLSEDKHSIRRLFTFPYQDENVRCWGGMFEIVYRGKLSDITMQPKEVSEVLCLSLEEILRMAEECPEDWMPDGLHAIKLYLQRTNDERVNRRLIEGYKGSDLNHYTLRPALKVIFFDCDDCLYFDNWTVANKLTAKIEDWCRTRKGLPKGAAYALYKEHGTALRGLLAEKKINNTDKEVDEFLREVHDLPITELLERDEKLRAMLLKIDPNVKKYVFTASVRDHAERCVKSLGIDDLFEGIVGVKECNLATKHSREAFEAAMRAAGVEKGDEESCILLDDSMKNIETGRKMGWRNVLIGRIGRDSGKQISSEHAEHEIDLIHEMPLVLPELFSV